MTSKKQPKTPLEEILFVVESTNDIVSKILEILEAKDVIRLTIPKEVIEELKSITRIDGR